jgi:hypothetical protein
LSALTLLTARPVLATGRLTCVRLITGSAGRLTAGLTTSLGPRFRRARSVLCARLTELFQLPVQVVEPIPQFLGTRQLTGQLSRLVVAGAISRGERVAETIQRTSEFLLRLAATGRRRTAAHRVGGLPHPLAEPLTVDFLRRFRSCLLHPAGVGARGGRRSATGRLLLQAFLNLLQPFGKAILVAGQPTQGIPGGITLTRTARLRSDLPLCIGELAGFELKIAERPPLAVRRVRLQLAFELAQLLECVGRTLGRLAAVLPPHLGCRAAHLLGDVAHSTTVLSAAVLALRILSRLLARLPGFTGLPRLARLSGLARLSRLTRLSGLP